MSVATVITKAHQNSDDNDHFIVLIISGSSKIYYQVNQGPSVTYVPHTLLDTSNLVNTYSSHSHGEVCEDMQMHWGHWQPGLRTASMFSLLPHCSDWSKSNGQTQDQRIREGEVGK